MGQRTIPQGRSVRARSTSTAPQQRAELAVFPSALGWFALLGSDGRVVALTFGHATADDARRAMTRQSSRHAPRAVRRGQTGRTSPPTPSDAFAALPWTESDWNPDLRARLQRFAEGHHVEFDDCAIVLPPMTPFQRRVIAATRRLRYGQTATYADLARRAGAPRAARAVGNVMRANTVPLIIPCHRVVAAGRLGGYSAPQGITLKKTLLSMEAETVGN